MTVQKGMDMLVEAVPMVLASYPEARFIISGEGPEKDAVVRRAHEVGAAGAIVFLGHVPRWQYIDLMRCCDILAVPSRNEPFGIVVLEGWAAGKPVVATTAGGPREFVWHDVNGFLVDANAGGMAHGIGSLLADHDHCRALGANGRRAVEEKEPWRKNSTGTTWRPTPKACIRSWRADSRLALSASIARCRCHFAACFLTYPHSRPRPSERFGRSESTLWHLGRSSGSLQLIRWVKVLAFHRCIIGSKAPIDLHCRRTLR